MKNQNNEVYTEVVLPFYKESKRAASFNGSFYFASDENKLIHDIEIKLEKVQIDILTTASWFSNGNKNFEKRKKIFKELNLPDQKIRLNTSESKLIELNLEQIEKLEKTLNRWLKKGLTIKNIITIIKGSNPSGEASKPSASELKTKHSNESFALLLKNLRINQKKYPESEKHTIKSCSLEKNFNDWVKEDKIIAKWFKRLNENGTNSDYRMIKKEIEKHVKIYQKGIINIIEKAIRKRNVYSKEIKKKYTSELLEELFGYVEDFSWQKAHIKSVKEIKDEAFSYFKEDDNHLLGNINSKIDSILDQIADSNNFLPLTQKLHDYYDRNIFQFHENGNPEIIKKSRVSDEILEELTKYKFNPISNDFLSSGRKKYLKEVYRNQPVIGN